MICFDTNVLIYLGNQTLGEELIGSEPICYASITAIEALGYPAILSAEEQRISELLKTMIEVPLSSNVIMRAVHLRQQKKMSLGDAIVAATALETNSELVTANVDDFAHIEELRVRNPLASGSA